MRWSLSLSVALVLNAFSFSSGAQTAPKVSLGLGATYARFNSPRRVAPTLTASLQVAPRLALQVGGEYYWRQSKSYFGSYFNLATNERHTEVVFTDYDRLLAVPVLARYTVTPLASKFHADVLGGATGLFYFGHYTETSTTQSQGTHTETRDSYNNFTGLLSLGLGLRYALTPQVEAVGDALVNTAWNTSPFSRYSRFPASYTLGVRYHFASH
jgi:hypothetical protein